MSMVLAPSLQYFVTGQRGSGYVYAKVFRKKDDAMHTHTNLVYNYNKMRELYFDPMEYSDGKVISRLTDWWTASCPS
jgi:hypothetical protein